MNDVQPPAYTQSRGIRILLSALGCVCVLLGVLGIFLPLLPTTPFLLLAAWLFARSSERFHAWLVSHPTLGPLITAWQDGRGINRGLRRKVLMFLWLSMLVSMIIVAKWWAIIMLTLIGTSVSIFLLKQPVIDHP